MLRAPQSDMTRRTSGRLVSALHDHVRVELAAATQALA